MAIGDLGMQLSEIVFTGVSPVVDGGGGADGWVHLHMSGLLNLLLTSRDVQYRKILLADPEGVAAQFRFFFHLNCIFKKNRLGSRCTHPNRSHPNLSRFRVADRSRIDPVNRLDIIGNGNIP